MHSHPPNWGGPNKWPYWGGLCFLNWSFQSASKLSQTVGPPGHKSYIPLYFPMWWSSQSSAPAPRFTLFTLSKRFSEDLILQCSLKKNLKPPTYFLLAKILNTLWSRQFFSPPPFFNTESTASFMKYGKLWPLMCVIQDKVRDSTKSLVLKYKKCLRYAWDVSY